MVQGNIPLKKKEDNRETARPKLSAAAADNYFKTDGKLTSLSLSITRSGKTWNDRDMFHSMNIRGLELLFMKISKLCHNVNTQLLQRDKTFHHLQTQSQNVPKFSLVPGV